MGFNKLSYGDWVSCCVIRRNIYFEILDKKDWWVISFFTIDCTHTALHRSHGPIATWNYCRQWSRHKDWWITIGSNHFCKLILLFHLTSHRFLHLLYLLQCFVSQMIWDIGAYQTKYSISRYFNPWQQQLMCLQISRAV